ncbi:MAG: MBL fold metallo-hydrolase [Proteiniphilum sp.]|nr:MBL fold metallo-hydrolase [Proteiniphilum sp.]
MQYELFNTEQFTFFSLGSGSSGNCYYLGNSKYGILIDAGIGPRIIKKRLAEHGVDMSTIWGVIITHDHYDHIRSVGYLGEKQNIPVYATEAVHRAISRTPLVRQKLNGSVRMIKKWIPFKIEDLKITAFPVPHDSMENVGYFIEFGNQKLMLATDIGVITDDIRSFMLKANHLVIESNYDEDMLVNGSYPHHLKDRITNGTGHLSNKETAQFLAKNYSAKLKNIWLCHLSGDNNHPQIAYDTVASELASSGVKVGEEVKLSVFGRNVLSEKTIL